MFDLDPQAIAELREALLSVECPPEAPQDAHVALTMLRAMYSELCDMALYTFEHEQNKADCDVPGYREWQDDRDQRLLGDAQVYLNTEDPALD